jgi:hypothetical protein
LTRDTYLNSQFLRSLRGEDGLPLIPFDGQTILAAW